MSWAAVRAYAGLAGSILATRFGAHRPFKITLSLTDRCDCRCQGCFIWAREKRPEPSPEAIGTLLRGMDGVRWVNLTGGEIFLRSDLVDVVAAVKRAVPGLVVLDFPTTGQQPARIAEDVARIAAMGIPRLLVTLSVEGPPRLHDALRGREGAFDAVVQTFCRLREIEGVSAWLGMTLHQKNAQTVERMLEAVRRRQPADHRPVGYADLHLNVWLESPHYYGNEQSACRAPRDAGKAVRRALRARRRSLSPVDMIEASYLRLLPAYLRTGRSPIPCRSLSASVFVATDGAVHPCTIWDRPLGNAYSQGRSLAEILRSAAAGRSRDLIAAHRCPGCWSPCEANPTLVAHAPGSLLRGPGRSS